MASKKIWGMARKLDPPQIYGPSGASGSMGPMQGFGALGSIWGGALGALGPIWGGALGRPKADIMEAEGRLNGGLGAEPPGKKLYRKKQEGPTQQWK